MKSDKIIEWMQAVGLLMACAWLMYFAGILKGKEGYSGLTECQSAPTGRSLSPKRRAGDSGTL